MDAVTFSDASTFTVAPVTGHIGAKISGIDVRAELSDGVKAELSKALHVYGVLFFSAGEPITDDEHYRFTCQFGDVKGRDEFAKATDELHFDVFDTAGQQYPTDIWHTDGTTWAHPPQASVLRCLVMPPAGGDTMWASMYAAYEALSSRYQRLLDGLEAVHSLVKTARTFTGEPAAEMRSRPGQIHPVIPRDQVTGRPMLYVNELFTERIEGLTFTESDRLLSFLHEHVNTPDFHVRLRWEPDTIAVWEERITQHRAVRDYFPQRRVVKRLEISGPPPAA